MTPEELRALLQQQEGERLEFKRNLPDRRTFATEIAAFANSDGGTLVLGVDERNRKPVGLAHPGVALDHIRQWASEAILPSPPIEVEAIDLEPGLTLGVVTVAPGANRPYIAEGRAVERRGRSVAPISPERITETASAQVPEEALSRLAGVIHEQSKKIEELTARLSTKKQLPLQITLAVGGVVAGYLLGLWRPLG